MDLQKGLLLLINRTWVKDLSFTCIAIRGCIFAADLLNLGIRLENVEQKQQQQLSMLTSFIRSISTSPVDAADCAEMVSEHFPNACQRPLELRSLNQKINDEADFRRQLVSLVLLYCCLF
jgi:hypothetical protein